MTDSAPEMTKDGRCSACNVLAIWAGDGELRICPQCYAMLEHDDLTAQERAHKEEVAARQRERVFARRAAREAEREAERDAKKHAHAVFKDHKL